MQVDARPWPVREERLLTVQTLLSFQEVPHQKLFFHLQESEDKRRARLDESDLLAF